MPEWRRLLAAARASGAREAALLMVMYECGLRASEPGLLRLSYARQLEAGRLYVWRGKGSRAEHVELSPATQSALISWIEERYPDRSRRKPQHYIFPGGRRHRGRRRGLSRWTVWSLFKRLAFEADLPDEVAHPHVLKHSRVQHLLEAAAEQPGLGAEKVLLAAAQVVGHRAAMTTVRNYAAATGAEQELLRKVTEEAMR